MTRSRKLSDFASAYENYGDQQAWGGAYKGFNIGSTGLAGGSGTTGGAFANNLYYDGSNWKYIATGYASLAFQSNGEFFVYTTASGTAGATASLGSPKFKIDNAGFAQVIGGTGLGYGTGSGGTVTQATSKATAVTLNKPTGQITMNGAALGPGAIVTFTLSNSLIAATDNVIVTANMVTGPYQAWCYQVGAGSCLIAVKNNNAGSLSEAVVLNFNIIKGANA